MLKTKKEEIRLSHTTHTHKDRQSIVKVTQRHHKTFNYIAITDRLTNVGQSVGATTVTEPNMCD